MKVPVGHYLVELNDNLKESIELVMNSQTVEVGHNNAYLTDFQVKSFSMFGSVKAGSKPLRNVKINVENVENSKEDMITDSDGSFVLKGVSKAPVVLKAMLDGYDFDPIVIDKVEPNMELAPVQPTRFRHGLLNRWTDIFILPGPYLGLAFNSNNAKQTHLIFIKL